MSRAENSGLAHLYILVSFNGLAPSSASSWLQHSTARGCKSTLAMKNTQ